MINSLLNRNNKRAKIDKICDCDGNVATSPQIIADKFNDYFANVAGKLKSELPRNTGNYSQFLGPSVQNSIYLTPTNSTEVSEIIDDLKINATADINVASIKRAKNSSPKFSDIIADIVNASFIEGVFPSLMKTAKTIPVHKGGSKIAGSLIHTPVFDQDYWFIGYSCLLMFTK